MAHVSELIAEDIEAYLDAHHHKSLLRFLTCGSVDDGKSTLIGRLLYDSKMIFEDQLAALEADSKKMGTQGGELDFAREIIEVVGGGAAPLGDDGVAATEPAAAFAEGQVHVERDRRLCGVSLGEKLIEVVRANVVLPDRGSGVAGVTRPGTVVAGQELLGDAKPVAIELQTEIGLTGVAHLATATGADWPARTKASAFSTGVSGRMPWPRLRM